MWDGLSRHDEGRDEIELDGLAEVLSFLVLYTLRTGAAARVTDHDVKSWEEKMPRIAMKRLSFALLNILCATSLFHQIELKIPLA